ncbi:MAG: carboxylating nicotinate-nucleotide diphosphorylase [Flavobacteriales bacterium]
MKRIIRDWLKEDVGSGDYSSLAVISRSQKGSAEFLMKEDGVIAGLSWAKEIMLTCDAKATIVFFCTDGDDVPKGSLIGRIEAKATAILKAERLMLNCLQRMSGIATQTRKLVDLISHTNAKLLDTRKTTPGFRALEKEAVRIGGGMNHRFGLYDMIMLKDNHIDYAGGVVQAVKKAENYKQKHGLSIDIEVEVRDLEELKQAITQKAIRRIMLDNFTPNEIKNCLMLIPSTFEVEASGGITESNIVEYAESGVHFISLGSLTHHVKSLDISLKATLK